MVPETRFVIQMLQADNNVGRIRIGEGLQQIRLLECLAFLALEIAKVEAGNGLGNF